MLPVRSFPTASASLLFADTRMRESPHPPGRVRPPPSRFALHSNKKRRPPCTPLRSPHTHHSIYHVSPRLSTLEMLGYARFAPPAGTEGRFRPIYRGKRAFCCGSIFRLLPGWDGETGGCQPDLFPSAPRIARRWRFGWPTKDHGMAGREAAATERRATYMPQLRAGGTRPASYRVEASATLSLRLMPVRFK